MSDIVSDMIHSFDEDHPNNGKKVGLFFGSFNPIHVGHLILANFIAESKLVDEIWFVVSPQNPHKEKANLLDEKHRLAIVKEAIDDNLNFKASDIEFKMSKPSYTVDTLAYLKESHPEYQFMLLMGEDNLRSFHKWKNYEVILKNFQIIVYPRVLTIQELEASKKVKPNELLAHENVTFIDAPLMKVSSSLIRKNIKADKSVKYLLTPATLKYVDDMNFYK